MNNQEKSSIANDIGSADLLKMSMQVSDQASAMLAYWDKEQICRFANNAYREWFGRSKEEMIGKISLKELLGPLYEKNLSYINAALSGNKQVFEREIHIPGGGIRHSLATYSPDISNGEIKGFFVHVADVTYIKALEEQLRSSRREMLRTVIETQEEERNAIVNVLRDSVSQTLAYAKMMLQSKEITGMGDIFHQDLSNNIQQAIEDLSSLSIDLVPSGIDILGFYHGVENYLEHFRSKHPVKFQFECEAAEIETLYLNDQLSVFRIIQDYLLMLADNPLSTIIHIKISYEAPKLLLALGQNDTGFIYPKQSKEFKDIEHRVEYYAGTMEALQSTDGTTLSITLNIH